jgi:hypothetical protein
MYRVQDPTLHNIVYFCDTLWSPDDGRRTRLKHVEHVTEINTLCDSSFNYQLDAQFLYSYFLIHLLYPSTCFEQ